jgi:hypothetical protein
MVVLIYINEWLIARLLGAELRRLSLPLWERKDLPGFSLFAKSLENPSEGGSSVKQIPL